jgi:putative phage-type endonuclease
MSKLIAQKIKLKPKTTLVCDPPPLEVQIIEVLEEESNNIIEQTSFLRNPGVLYRGASMNAISQEVIEELTLEVVVVEELTLEPVIQSIEAVVQSIEEVNFVKIDVIDQTQLSPLVMKGKKKCSPKKISPKKTKSIKNSFEKTKFPPKVLLHDVNKYEEKLEKFRKMPFYAQKTEGWLKQRCNYLTASSISHAISEKTLVARQNLLLEKVSYGTYKPFKGGVATQWGNKYEPVANAIYSYRNNVKVEEFAMITNEKYPILGISPDGILPDRMLEIKCPFSRTIDGKIKPEYYHQMQEQMAVCEYDKCDFLEVKLKEVDFDHFWIDFAEYDCEKGIILMSIDLLEPEAEKDGHTIKYMYSPIEYYGQHDKMETWYNDQLKAFQNSSSQLYIDESYWVLDKYNCQLVYRHEDWIPYFYPILEEFWRDVEHYRKVGLDQLLKDLEDLKPPQSPQTPQQSQLEGCCFSSDDEIDLLPLKTKSKVNTKVNTKTKCLL